MHEPREVTTDKPKLETRVEVSRVSVNSAEGVSSSQERVDGVLPISGGSAAEGQARREVVFIIGENAKILFGSTALYSTLGFEAHELPSRSLFEVMDPSDAADLAGMLEAIDPRSESSTRLRLELRHRDGSFYVLVGTTTAIYEDGFGRSYIMRVRVAAVNPGS